MTDYLTRVAEAGARTTAPAHSPAAGPPLLPAMPTISEAPDFSEGSEASASTAPDVENVRPPTAHHDALAKSPTFLNADAPKIEGARLQAVSREIDRATEVVRANKTTSPSAMTPQSAGMRAVEIAPSSTGVSIKPQSTSPLSPKPEPISAESPTKQSQAMSQPIASNTSSAKKAPSIEKAANAGNAPGSVPATPIVVDATTARVQIPRGLRRRIAAAETSPLPAIPESASPTESAPSRRPANSVAALSENAHSTNGANGASQTAQFDAETTPTIPDEEIEPLPAPTEPASLDMPDTPQLRIAEPAPAVGESPAPSLRPVAPEVSAIADASRARAASSSSRLTIGRIDVDVHVQPVPPAPVPAPPRAESTAPKILEPYYLDRFGLRI